MKKFLLFSLCLANATLFSFEVSRETPSLKDPKEIIQLQLEGLDRHIAMTQSTLSQMQGLHKEIAEYQHIQDLYLERIGDKQLLYRMLKNADSLLRHIKADNLVAIFDPEFISELNTLSTLFNKASLPRP